MKWKSITVVSFLVLALAIAWKQLTTLESTPVAVLVNSLKHYEIFGNMFSVWRKNHPDSTNRSVEEAKSIGASERGLWDHSWIVKPCPRG